MRKFFNRVKKIAIGIGRFVTVVVRSARSIYMNLRTIYKRYRKQMEESVAFIYALLLDYGNILPRKYARYAKASILLVMGALSCLDVIFQVDPSII